MNVMNESPFLSAEHQLAITALRGKTVENIHRNNDLTEDRLAESIQCYFNSKLPRTDGLLPSGVQDEVEIMRDHRGIPHIYANCDHDLFFALGFVMAQDRLFQMDCMRREANGRLAEILGKSKLESDILNRTLGITRIAHREAALLTEEANVTLEAFSSGINELIQAMLDKNTPLGWEFEVLEYTPALWQAQDSIAILRSFWWYLTGRLNVIAGPENAKQTLGTGDLYRAFLMPEGSDETIIRKGEHPTERTGTPVPVGEVVGTPDEGGSNNWVVSGAKSVSGHALLASDPHLPFTLPSVCYEAHLCSPNVNTAGMVVPGAPGVLMGRNESVAWGATNNISSIRDLYRIQVSDDGMRYHHDNDWKPLKTIVEKIEVKNQEPILHEVQWTEFGPIVNHLLSKGSANSTPLALRWLGFEHTDDIQVILDFERASSIIEMREALSRWKIPAWNYLGADTHGHIMYQCVGQIPLRGRPERGYRNLADTNDSWRGFIPFEGMPHLIDPDRNWIASANNAVVPFDYPYPLSGTWASDHRAQRVRDLLGKKDKFSRKDFEQLQQDVYLVRAQDLVPKLLAALGTPEQERTASAICSLSDWDYTMKTDDIAPAIFDTWFLHWRRTVARARFPSEMDEWAVSQVAGLAGNLLNGDPMHWFNGIDTKALVHESFVKALDWLAEHLGPDINSWKWGRLHTLTLKHTLATQGTLLQELTDIGPIPIPGGNGTVNNAIYGADSFETFGGPNYRMTCDLADDVLYTCSLPGQSANPASPHYKDQVTDWLEGRQHKIPLNRKAVEVEAKSVLRLTPQCVNE